MCKLSHFIDIEMGFMHTIGLNTISSDLSKDYFLRETTKNDIIQKIHFL